MTGFPNPATAGMANPVTVTAYDPYGNIATGYRGTIAFTSTDPLAELPAPFSFAAANAGTATFSATLKTVGTQSITATDQATSTITGSESVTVTDGGAARRPLSKRTPPRKATGSGHTAPTVTKSSVAQPAYLATQRSPPPARERIRRPTPRPIRASPVRRQLQPHRRMLVLLHELFDRCQHH